MELILNNRNPKVLKKQRVKIFKITITLVKQMFKKLNQKTQLLTITKIKHLFKIKIKKILNLWMIKYRKCKVNTIFNQI